MALTMDGVIANWVKGLRAHVAARHAVADRQLALNVSWDLSEWDVADPAGMIREFLLSPMSGRLKLVEGAEGGIAALQSAGFRVVAVTRRDHMVGDNADDRSKTREITRQWFAGQPHLGIGDADIMFTEDPVAIDADVWVDDAPRRVKRLVEAEKPVWVLPQPWNRSVVQHPGVRVLFDGWSSVDDLIATHSA
ncbi:MAG: hypothetical protein OXC00_01230 [Acidimicrobiaceae bacterium]|nr:hypothetical protein [Acidimicrobiaceae bacterium]